MKVPLTTATILSLALFGAAPLRANILITEVNSNSAGGDFFEIYNAGSSQVDLTGWRWTDYGLRAYLTAFSLAANTKLAAGEVAIIVAGTVTSNSSSSLDIAFKSHWSLPDSVKIIGWSGVGAGLGKGDGVMLFDASGNLAASLIYAGTPSAATSSSASVPLSTYVRSDGVSVVTTPTQHAGLSAGGVNESVSLVWDPNSLTSNTTYLAAVIGEYGARGVSGSLSIGSPGKLFSDGSPVVSLSPFRLFRAGQSSTVSVEFIQNNGNPMSFALQAKGGGPLPPWITRTIGSGYANITVSPAGPSDSDLDGDAGVYELEMVITDTTTLLVTTEVFVPIVLPASSEVLINEANTVGGTDQLEPLDTTTGDGQDTFFGRVAGNGGDWLELVVVGNGSAGTVDMRGWKIEIDDVAGAVFAADDTIVLSRDSYWAAVPNGTILTFTENSSAEDGLDTWINKVNRLSQSGGSTLNQGGYAWSNIHIFDRIYIDQAQSNFGDGIAISSSNTHFRILKPLEGVAGQFVLVAGPIGEGIAPPTGVSGTEVLELEIDPNPVVSSWYAEGTGAWSYDDGKGSTFGAPNQSAGGTAAQNFSAFQTTNSAPTFSNQPTKYAVEGVAYSWTAETADAEDSIVTVTEAIGSTLPTWLRVEGKTLSGTPAQGSAGFYDVELSATDGASTTPLKFRLTVFNNDPSIILNEYNAVDNSGTTMTFLNGGTQALDSAGGTASDVHFGRVAGNGADWVEFVVTGNGSGGTTDLRGYTIEIDEGASSGYFSAKVKIKLSTASFWEAVPNGTILTFTESKTAEGGMDTNLVAADNSATTGQRWANVWVGDLALITYTDLATNGYSLTAGVVSGINIDDTETQFRVLNSAGYPVSGPAGEGIAPLNNISNTDVLELEGHPTASVLPTDRSDDTVTPPKNGYDNSSKDSTFGAPNQWHFGSGGVLTTQDFTPYKAAVATDGYALYLKSKGLTAGTAFDARVNGVQVGLAYAFGTASGSPANNGVVAVPTMSGNEMTYVFDRVVDSALTVKAFTSLDLVAWTEVPVVSATGGVTPANIIKQKVVATGVGKLFVKISVTHP